MDWHRKPWKAINLGDNGEGKTVYGLMALTKNAATRVTALVYLDGTKLTNQMVLASGDIQGNLNIQFGSYTASKVEKTTTDTDGTTNTDESYIHGKDNESIKDDSLMDDKIAVSASVTSSQFTYNPSNPAKTTLNVKVDGVTPNTVSARFIRAISSTQGVQQDEVALDGSGDSWSKEFTFSRPGNYVLRTVWVDGSEYDLENPITVTVTGASVNSLTCDAIPAGSSRATIMTADGSVSTNLTLGFTSSAQIPGRVNGLFMDENGRQVNVPFSLKSGTWTGTATFNTSGTYTMKYVEIDGDTYELRESLQPTLELLLGLKVNTVVSASQETLNKLQAVNPTAMPTKFVLDPGKLPDGVTLNVAVKVYDNNGNELPGLSGIELYYGRVGSSILSRGLYSTLRWSADAESYTGSFLVTQAGTFSFNKVVVKTGEKTNTITAKTSAPNIQAIPPEDASYFNNYTDTYQYSPLRNATMTIGVAYSSAATKIEATLRNGATVKTVEGTMGREADDQGDKTVNLWSFKVPEINESQEGEWTLTDITLYGVYYGGQYYDENGVTIDLSAENIHTKVVNYVYTTLRGTSQNFNGYFMDDHKVNDMTISIADYEGEPIKAQIANVKVVYNLNASKVSVDTYGYTADNLASVNISGEGTLVTGSQTEYKISEMNFKQAGPYDGCTVSFEMDGVSVTAGKDSYKMKYMDGETISEQCPKYDVTWTLPSVKITALNPAPSKTYEVNVGDMSGHAMGRETHTYISEDGLYAYMSAEMGGVLGGFTSVTWPKMTLALSNAGSNFSSAKLSIPKANGDNARDYTFTTRALSQQQTIGTTNGSRYQAGNQIMKTIDMVYGSSTYVVKLKDALEIYEVEQPIGTYTFDMSSAVANPPEGGEIVHPSEKIKLPSVDNYAENITEDGKAGTRSEVSSKSERVYYRKGFGNYQYRDITTKQYKTPYTGDTFAVTYKVTGWIVERLKLSDGSSETLNNGKPYVPGTQITVSLGYEYVITPVTEEVTRMSIGSKTTYYYEEETTATGFNRAVTEPNGTKFNNESLVNRYVDSVVGTKDLGWKDN